MSGFNINYVEDHGDDYDPNMEEFVATNEWQQVKHGMNFVSFCLKFSVQIMAITRFKRGLVAAELFEIAVSVGFNIELVLAELVTIGKRVNLCILATGTLDWL